MTHSVEKYGIMTAMKTLNIAITLFFTFGLTSSAFAEINPSEILGQNIQDKLSSEQSAKDRDEQSEVSVPKMGDWKLKDLEGDYLTMNPLRFTNRASCARDANKPATSVNLLIDAMYPSKMIYRLGQATGNEPKQLTLQGVQRFRTASYRLLERIATLVLNGDLPLLPAYGTKNENYLGDRYEIHAKKEQQYDWFQLNDTVLDRYLAISASCRLDEDCPALNDYLEALWNAKGDRDAQRKIDSFSNRHHYVNAKRIKDNNNYGVKLGCHYLKKFSPLMAQVSTVSATKSTLQSIALTQAEQNEFITSCDDLDAQPALDAVAYQLDITNLDARYWNKIGFDFWNTVKLFYSWSFRYANDIDDILYPFENVFKSIALEESVMIFSTDCRGLTLPKCDNDFLSSQRIRDFAKIDFTKTALNNDFMKQLPEGADQAMLDDPFANYNDDILDYGKFDDMGKWAKSFAGNIRKGRTYHKKQLVEALTYLDLLFEKVSVEDIVNNIAKVANHNAAWAWPNEQITASETKDQLYYLCAEFEVGMNEDMSFVRADIDNFKDVLGIQNELKNITGNDYNSYVEYVKGLATGIKQVCNQLEGKRVWSDHTVNRDGFALWFQEVINRKVTNESPLKIDDWANYTVRPFIQQNTVQGKKILALNGTDAARRALESVINVHATFKYLNTFMNSTEALNSPSLLNPYAERTACKVYDPWWKVKKTLHDSVSDIAMAAINFSNPLPVYIDASYRPNRAVSFNKMIQDGVVTYDPNMSNDNLYGSLKADFSVISSIPCAIEIGNDGAMAGDSKRYFAGYTFRGCVNAKNGGEIRVTDPSNISAEMASNLGACASCSINFQTVPNIFAAVMEVPYVNSSYYLLRGIVNFYRGFSDKVEIPHYWEVDVNNVYQTYRRYGEIPDKCVKSLVKGDYCMPQKCEYTIASAAGKLFNAQVENIDIRGDQALVKLNKCKNSILVQDLKTLGLFCRNNLTKENFILNSSCNFED